MAAEERTALAVTLAAAAFSAAFFLSTTIDVPLLWYDPVAGQASFGHRPSTVAIDWYGRTLVSCAAAALAFFVTRSFAKAPRPGTIRVALGWAGVAFTLAAGLYASGLYGRRARPEPLPSWYEPR